MYIFNKKVIQSTTVMESDKIGAALQTVMKAFEGVGGLSETEAMMKQMERVPKDEIRTAFMMLMDGKSLDEIETAMQWAGYSMAEIGTVLWEAQHLKQEWERGFRDLGAAMGRIPDDMPAGRVPDDMPAGYEEKAIRDYFQTLVDTAKIVDAHAIYGIIMVANKLNAEHGYRYPSYIAELDEVLRMKTNPSDTYRPNQRHSRQRECENREMTDMADIKMNIWGNVTIGTMFDIHDNENVVINTSQANAGKPRKRGKVDKVCTEPPYDKPMTLKYYRHGHNGKLAAQRHRVDILYRKWTEWGWMDPNTRPDDFEAFFEGEPRHCNITWTANSTVLTILLQELLKQDYIEAQTNCSAKSLVREQFGKEANSDRRRLDSTAEERISLSLLILDTGTPLPERSGRAADGEDTSDAALCEVFAGALRLTKGI